MNNDIFRQEYTPLSDEQKESVQQIKQKAQELYDLFCTLPGSRENSIAKTELENAIMWAVKAATAHVEQPAEPAEEPSEPESEPSPESPEESQA